MSSSSSRIIKLNVGGKLFMTSRDTLLRFPSSTLATMINGHWHAELEDGAFFIDRSPRHFEFILEFLRTGYLAPVPVELGVQALAREARFYLLEELAELIETQKYRPTAYEFYAMLPGKNFANLDLSGMNLRNQDFHDFDFADSEMTGVNLQGANLAHTVFTNANLTGADLTGAVLRGTVFTGALLDGADLDGAKVNYSTELKGATLGNASLRNIEGWQELTW